MNNVKKSFSIRDMENLSGIMAHTIRIWEKRYNLFTPERTSTNIRTYSLASLQKLLNVTFIIVFYGTKNFTNYSVSLLNTELTLRTYW